MSFARARRRTYSRYEGGNDDTSGFIDRPKFQRKLQLQETLRSSGERGCVIAAAEELRVAGLLTDPRDYMLILNALGRVREPDAALAVLTHASGPGGRFELDPMLWNTAMHACTLSCRWATALGLLATMSARGVATNEVSYSTCIGAVASAGAALGGGWRRVLELLAAQRRAVSPGPGGGSASASSTIVGAALSALGVHGRWARAIALLDELLAEVDTG